MVRRYPEGVVALLGKLAGIVVARVRLALTVQRSGYREPEDQYEILAG
jgi:hypothetical protein